MSTRLPVLTEDSSERPTRRQQIEAQVLAAELRATVSGEVRFDDGSRALYSTDASNYRQIPIGVVVPRTADDIVATVALCHARGVPVLLRGGGTSLAGQTCNVAVVVDCSKYYNRILEIDPTRRIARVEPGLILDTLRDAAEEHNLTFGPDPATHNRCTLGGMIGNDSCGAHSVMAGRTESNVEELDVLTYDGLRFRVGATSDEEYARILAEGGRRADIYRRLKALGEKYAPLIRERFPNIPRRVSGYNLPQLLPESDFNLARALVGTESTCVTVLEATLKLVHSPKERVLVVLGYPDIYTACDHVPDILATGPIALEGFDEHLVHDMRKKHLHSHNIEMLPPGDGWLLVEFGANEHRDAVEQARHLMAVLQRKGHAPHMKLFEDKRAQKMIWEVRESGLGGTARIPDRAPNWPGWEDSAVEPEKMGAYLRDLRKLVDKFEYTSAFYGHMGQGCLHTRMDFDFGTTQGIAKFRAFMEQAADLCLKYGGSLSGEHGDGQSRAELLPKMFGPELVEAFREFKEIWDPDWKMNPGKMVDPYRMDQNLRLGTNYEPAQPTTHFKFPEDKGSLAYATTRCVGVGKCRRLGEGLMCPSFMVTREEADSTRGRAHALFEMLRGDDLGGGWRNEAVKDALDLCFACKGCKKDCPVNVDMATYKAEFLSHYYAGRLRPMTAYSMGWIYWWSRLAAMAPWLANFATQAPILSNVTKALGGISQHRRMPPFAGKTFKQWFRERGGTRVIDGPTVLLWPDTFNNYFKPESAVAAVEVLEDAGYQVLVPEQSLCCGRPLYDFGMLDMAEDLLRQILDTLRPLIREGVPVVGLEPSCISVFRDELTNLFPNDEDAKRLQRQSYLLSEFLRHKHYSPPKLERKALVHGHCHHKSIFGMEDEEALLREMGVEYRAPESGCCGMAGAFGFEHEHYEISMKAGERVLLPAVRSADEEELIISDGFSCREQIEQGTNRKALHFAEVLAMGLQRGPEDTPGKFPARGYAHALAPRMAPGRVLTLAVGSLAIVGAVAGAVWARARRE